MRMIDADKVVKNLEEKMKEHKENRERYEACGHKSLATCEQGLYYGIKEAIEIVKKGG